MRKPTATEMPKAAMPMPECFFFHRVMHIQLSCSDDEELSHAGIGMSMLDQMGARCGHRRSCSAVGGFGWLAGAVAWSALNFAISIRPPSHFVLRRGSLRFTLRSKRRLVPEEGIEPPTKGL